MYYFIQKDSFVKIGNASKLMYYIYQQTTDENFNNKKIYKG